MNARMYRSGQPQQILNVREKTNHFASTVAI